MKRWRIRLLGFLARLVYGVVVKTVRPVFAGDGAAVSAAMERGEPLIFAFFHGQLAMMQAPYRGRRGLAIQMSRSGDGEIVARAIAPYGIEPIRGSSSRGGVSSLRALVEAMERGRDLGFACDGPRGPFHVVKAGVVHAARLTGARVFPVAAAPGRGFVFARSWDRFTIPLPFTRVFLAFGEPFSVARDADDAVVEAIRAGLEGELRRLFAIAESRARGSLD